MNSTKTNLDNWKYAPALLLVFILSFFAFQIFSVYPGSFLFLPPEKGDGPDYDNIALSISKGRGYSVWYSDAEWKKPYIDYNYKNYYSDIVGRRSLNVPTTYRPPLLPLLLSSIYKIFGRNFEIWRLLNTFFVAIAAGLTCAVAYKLKGMKLAILTGILVLLDFQFNSYGMKYLTESISALLIIALIYELLFGSKSYLRSACIGMLIGTLVLARSIFMQWIPPLFILYSILLFKEDKTRKDIIISLSISLISFLVAVFPWSYRNVKLLGDFYPFGIQGPGALAVAYNDQMIADKGVWKRQNFQSFENEFNLHHKNSIKDIERDFARYSVAEGKKWIFNNYTKLPRLFYLKTSSLLWFHSSYLQKILLLCSILSFLFFYREIKITFLFMVILINVVSVGLTWSYYDGRFLIPIHPILHLLTALMFLSMFNLPSKLNELNISKVQK
jgi:4-amino-4-deoxy-L-arabinose transferase-like glycosyltransferase